MMRHPATVRPRLWSSVTFLRRGPDGGSRSPVTPIGRALHTPAVLSFLGELLLGLLLDPSAVFDEVRDRRRRRRSRKRARASKIPCAVRVVSGAHPGLGRRWTRGAARVPPGSLVFEPHSSWRPQVTVPVRSATLQAPGHVPWWRSRALGPQPRRIVLETARATLEWLVPEDQLQRSLGVTSASVRDLRPPTG